MRVTNLDNDEIKAPVYDFEHCGVHGGCDRCKCYEDLKGRNFNICELFLTYRKGITDKITELLNNM